MSDRVQDLHLIKIKRVVRAYERRIPMNEIAEMTGVSPPTIAKWLKQEGYKHKKSGRIPLAMKARVRELHKSGWEDEDISTLLVLGMDQVKELSKPKQNPILSGKDPLKVKGQKKKKKEKKKKKPKLEPGEKWPPDRHKCSKHWTENEKAYVLQLITKKVAPIAIYKRMRASKKRQRRIWAESGGKGDPPNFPPPKGPFIVPGEPGAPAPSVTPTKAQERARELAAAGKEQIALLEAEALERKKRIAELEKLKQIEEKHIKDLSAAQKKLSRAAREQLAVTESALAAVRKRKGLKPAKSKPKRVLKDSYEAEVLGLTVGSLVEPKRLGRPPSKKSIEEYADNGRYFVVSKDWTDLKKAKPDELKLFADYMNSKRFPMRVERNGDQPQAFYKSLWPKKIEKRWEAAVDSGLILVDKYRKKKAILRKKKMFSERIAIYLSAVYDGYRNRKMNAAQRKEARELAADHWVRLGKLERLVMIYDMKLADADGKPTTLGVDRSMAAKMLLEKASKRAARKLTERRVSTKKKAIREEAGDAVALPEAEVEVVEAEPEDEEDEIAKMLAKTQLMLDEPDED